ncbi:MAG TPA: 6,7-dimethyl-8-ribityllumazine synthase, partial [Phenylobacterium sp.]|nr:6,7-dimethyl-8-ribityllumazine synthase [Phenylobacterium sp.]
MLEDKIRILIVEARFYDDLADELLKGAADIITAHDAEYDVVSVPGALEIPGAIAHAEEAGHRPAGVRYDGYVALGTVIRGETY